MKTIKLTQGKNSMVDDEDFEILSAFKWHAHRAGELWYADNRHVGMTMHRYLMGPSKGIFVDHIDGNGLNNQKSNLRLASHAENMRNRKMAKNNTSGFKGVSWDNKMRKWKAQIRINSVRIYLGIFISRKEADVVYKQAALKYHGEFTRL